MPNALVPARIVSIITALVFVTACATPRTTRLSRATISGRADGADIEVSVTSDDVCDFVTFDSRDAHVSAQVCDGGVEIEGDDDDVLAMLDALAADSERSDDGAAQLLINFCRSIGVELERVRSAPDNWSNVSDAVARVRANAETAAATLGRDLVENGASNDARRPYRAVAEIIAGMGEDLRRVEVARDVPALRKLVFAWRALAGLSFALAAVMLVAQQGSLRDAGPDAGNRPAS